MTDSGASASPRDREPVNGDSGQSENRASSARTVSNDAASEQPTMKAAQPPVTTDANPGAIPAQTLDPGSVRLVNDLLEAIGEPGAGLVIAVRGLRNQSRTPGDEMTTLRERLHQLLAAAGEPRGLRLTLDEPTDADYTLSGTVYLVNRDGFDQWEIYLALRPAEANWTIWRNDDPVRLMRQQRAAGDALLVAPRR